MQPTLFSRMPGRWLMLFACLLVYPAMAQNLLATNQQQRRVFLSQKTSANPQTLKSLLSDIEKKHGVSFICKSKFLEMEVDTKDEDFSGNAFAKKLQKVLNPCKLKVQQISNEQFAISGDTKNQTQKNKQPQRFFSGADIAYTSSAQSKS